MEQHQTIILEEPYSNAFFAMLESDLSIEDYPAEYDSEFPVFNHYMCGLLKKLHQSGKEILQIDPYLEKLIRIRELFAAGKRP